jgi:ParB family chromosome partitioning protein
VDIKISDILIDDNFNSRGEVIPNDVRDLMRDIEKEGLLQPVIVTPCEEENYSYRLIAGFRRTYAHKFLGRETIRAEVLNNLSTRDARIINLKENLIRKNLNILQEARAVRALMDENGLNQTEAAREIGKTSGWVNMRIKCLDMDEDTKNAIVDGTLSTAHVSAIVRIKKLDERHKLIKAVKEHKERGENISKIKAFNRKKVKPHERKERKPHEIEALNSHLIDETGGCLATRALAWATGNVSDIELFEDFEREYPNFKRPEIKE